jgi:hypothetical protein
MNPAFPDIVGEWARGEALFECGPANDNRGCEAEADTFVEIFLLEIARRDIESSRVW